MTEKSILPLRFSPLIPILLITLVLFIGCASKKDILYMQDIERLAEQQQEMYANPIIRPNDILMINVSADDMDVAMPFNLLAPAQNMQQMRQQTLGIAREIQGYIVDADGTIQFPILGELQVGGMTRQDLLKMLYSRIGEHIQNPIINVRITNYKVTIIGEVTRPGAYSIGDERVTLLEALGMAGDLTIYGKRDNILIIREENGLKNYKVIDLTKSDFLHSDFYYLQQNDVVYVQPNGPQVQASAYNRNVGAWVSIASLLISVILLIDRF